MRAGGFEPPWVYAQRIFVPATAFAAPPSRRLRDARLWSRLSLRRAPDRFRGLGAARLVSTPSRPGRSQAVRSGLGSGLPFHRFPRIWAVLRPAFPRAHSSSQVRCVYWFRHARVALLYNSGLFLLQNLILALVLLRSARFGGKVLPAGLVLAGPFAPDIDRGDVD